MDPSSTNQSAPSEASSPHTRRGARDGSRTRARPWRESLPTRRCAGWKRGKTGRELGADRRDQLLETRQARDVDRGAASGRLDADRAHGLRGDEQHREPGREKDGNRVAMQEARRDRDRGEDLESGEARRCGHHPGWNGAKVRTTGTVHISPHAHHDRTLRPDPRRASQAGPGISTRSATSSRRSSGPSLAGRLRGRGPSATPRRRPPSPSRPPSATLPPRPRARHASGSTRTPRPRRRRERPPRRAMRDASRGFRIAPRGRRESWEHDRGHLLAEQRRHARAEEAPSPSCDRFVQSERDERQSSEILEAGRPGDEEPSRLDHPGSRGDRQRRASSGRGRNAR